MLTYDEFRDWLERRGMSVQKFADTVGLHRVTVCQWPHPPGWVEPLLDAWDEIERLRSILGPPGRPRELIVDPEQPPHAALPW